jgi:MurNAc alpha-1-phosphate uridylyltransferase
MQKIFFENEKKCLLLVVNKKKSFDKSIKGDFNLKDNLISRKHISGLNYIYTGLQIIKPEVFSNINKKVFSINSIWDKLILSDKLHAIESNINFLHVSTLDIYKSLLKKI